MEAKVADTVGRRLLLRWLENSNQTELARRIGVSISALCRWVSMSRRPDADARDLMKHHLDIPQEAWSTFIDGTEHEAPEDPIAAAE